MTRGRDTNTAYLYDRPTEHEYPPVPDASAHRTWRADSSDAAHTLRNLIAHTDERPSTANEYAVRTPNSALPEQVQHLIQRRQRNLQRRQTEHRVWQAELRVLDEDLTDTRARHAGRSRSVDEGLEL